MKKFLLSMAAGALALTASAVPAFAAETGKGTTNVGYSDGAVTDPDNPTSPKFSVSIPKDFMFVKDTKESQDMTVKLNVIKVGSIAGEEVKVEVASANSYTLKNTGATVTSLDYTLTYGSSNMAKNDTIQEVGKLQDVDGKREIAGEAVLPHDQLTQVGVDGVYTDILTYTIHGATAVTVAP